MLKVSRSKCYELKDEIGYLKVGGSVRFRREDVVAWLERCRQHREQPRHRRPRLQLKHITLPPS